MWSSWINEISVLEYKSLNIHKARHPIIDHTTNTGIQWLCEPCQVPVAESSRISSESSAAILDSSEFNPTRVDSYNVSLLISFLSFRFPVHLFNEQDFELHWKTLPICCHFLSLIALFLCLRTVPPMMKHRFPTLKPKARPKTTQVKEW